MTLKWFRWRSRVEREAVPTGWAFPDAPGMAVFTLKRIMRRKRPVLAVWHDAEDGAWQFLDGSQDFDERDGAVVALEAIVRLDPTLAEVADLPRGWVAWRRRVGGEWERREE